MKRTFALILISVLWLSAADKIQAEAGSGVDSETSTRIGVESDVDAAEQVQVVVQGSVLELRNLVVDADGFLVNTSSDGYLTMGGMNLPRTQACHLLLDVEFKQAMFRPGLFEVFWATDPAAFGEGQKAQVLISHKDTVGPKVFVIPLCKLYGFSGNLSEPNLQRNLVGLRLDYPYNREIGLRFNSIKLLSHQELADLTALNAQTITYLEPYERLSGRAFTSFDVVIPKLYFSFEDGLRRLSGDLPFLLVWLSLIAALMVLILRSFLAKK